MARIAFVLVDPFADWEPALLAAGAREDFKDEVSWLSLDGKPVPSMGGLTVQADGVLDDSVLERADALVLIGSPLWQTSGSPDLSSLLRRAVDRGLVVAGICGATLALARAGLLDTRAHTSNALEFLQQHAAGYNGSALYRHSAQAVSDGRVVTAPGSAPVTFAVEVLQLLHPGATAALGEFRRDFAREHPPG
ncbi:glutamine amidotransferase [Myxococcus stipitatus]|uniref:type 1 glutamine amidotransferase family protein n=1 Tax=Myxococcus stipitatus TaxID=83455 RepID=UPI001F1E5C20|nr:type 1 glutamine amidotransferase family protein [Myxococcus stipitatus]MCE9670987.1 glutamine amidotransferase [Myxococcus stipitatus]